MHQFSSFTVLLHPLSPFLFVFYHLPLCNLDQSLLEEYEQHVRERQKELEALRNQREELLQLEAMLQDLLISQEEGKREEEEEEEEEETDDEATYSESREEKVMAELQRQRQLRDELMKKAERLQQLKGVSLHVVCVCE